jgi:hypothetical protein
MFTNTEVHIEMSISETYDYLNIGVLGWLIKYIFSQCVSNLCSSVTLMNLAVGTLLLNDVK